MSLLPEHTIKGLDDAIATGSLQLARAALSDRKVLHPRQASHYLQALLLQNPFSTQSLAIRGDTPRLASLMAPDEASYEQGMAIITAEIAHRADLRNADTEPAKMLAFAAAGYEFRRPAAVTLLQEVLKQDASWRPDIAGHFANIGDEDDFTPEDTRAFRAEAAAQMRAVGHSLRCWLQETPDVRERMHPFNQQWWMQAHWDVNPDMMPWANRDDVRRANERSNLANGQPTAGEDRAAARSAVQIAGDFIEQVRLGSRGGRKPPGPI